MAKPLTETLNLNKYVLTIVLKLDQIVCHFLEDCSSNLLHRKKLKMQVNVNEFKHILNKHPLN